MGRVQGFLVTAAISQQMPLVLTKGQCPYCLGKVVAKQASDYPDYAPPFAIRVRMVLKLIRRIDLYECEECSGIFSVRRCAGGDLGVFEGYAEEAA